MDKLKCQAEPFNKILEKVKELCPSAIQNGKIDFERLKIELTDCVDENIKESYDFTWVGKGSSIVSANTPTTKTLRPAKDESKNWDTTENLYIEGDNLEVLKLLQESYLNKIKMIYIDPPYNTGKDFVYKDNFTKCKVDYNAELGLENDEGERLFRNTETNGRFHSDWCSMMYPRLKLARDFLTDDGVIFISIDDNEVANLRKICDEVFGEDNFESMISWRRRTNQPNDATKMIAKVSEQILVYAKNSNYLKEKKAFYTLPISDERLASYTNPDNDARGDWSSTPWCASRGQGGSLYELITPTNKIYNETWLGTRDTFQKLLNDNRIIFPNNGDGKPRKKIFKFERIQQGQAAVDFWFDEKYGDNLSATAEIKTLFGDERLFDYPKPVNLIKTFLCLTTKSDIILDFFSGSATTAHAVMQLNAEDGGNRKFIMVQLPETTDSESEAFKAGYKNICEIGKERIRRAGEKISSSLRAKGEATQSKNDSMLKLDCHGNLLPRNDNDLDIGFHVLKLDESNMKDVYYSPAELKQQNLLDMIDNVKNDRGALDLLFGVLIDWGVSLSLPIIENKMDKNTFYIIGDNDIVACFDKNITTETITKIAELKPTRAVFRDSSFESDADKINAMEIFKAICGWDDKETNANVKVI